MPGPSSWNRTSMAASLPDRTCARCCGRAAALLRSRRRHGRHARPAAPVEGPARSTSQAASSDFDYKNNTLLFKRVKITQGPLKVRRAARRARPDSTSTTRSGRFQGDVKITVPDGKLTRRDAKVMFRNNAIARARRSRARRRSSSSSSRREKLAQGRANTIDVRRPGQHRAPDRRRLAHRRQTTRFAAKR